MIALKHLVNHAYFVIRILGQALHVQGVPQPMPDYESLSEYHYEHVDSKPINIDGVTRPVDDFQPRKQINEAFRKEKFH